MDEESQVRGCYNFYLHTNQETVSVLEKTQANKKDHESNCKV